MQVYGVTWDPFAKQEDIRFVTWGKKHCKLWTAQPVAGVGKASSTTWAPFLLSFGRYDLQNVHSAAFLPVTRALVLGLARGDLLVIEGTQAVRSIAAHQPGPQLIADDGNVTYSGVRGMALHCNNSVLLTAGMHQKFFSHHSLPIP